MEKQKILIISTLIIFILIDLIAIGGLNTTTIGHGDGHGHAGRPEGCHIIIAVVVLAFLCCCCMIVLYGGWAMFEAGDFMSEFGNELNF